MSTKANINANTLRKLEKITGQKLTLGGILSAIRQGDEKTLQEFADILDISKQYLSDLEHGRRYASPKAAVEYAKKLGYSPEQFLRLCLQDIIDRDHLNMLVDIKKAA